jgi:hypothetical protein
MTVLETRFSASEAAHWSAVWARISANHRSAYDAIVTFANLVMPHCKNAANEAAWFRVLLIDAVTQAERARRLAA